MSAETSPEDTRGTQETERVIARITRRRGLVMFSREDGKWFRASAGTPLLAGDRLDTRAGMARLELDGGAILFANRKTLLRMRHTAVEGKQAILVDLSRGEVFITEARDRKDPGPGTHVETPDSLISPVGTRFDVKRILPHTDVVVEEGAVLAHARKKRSQAAGPRAAETGAGGGGSAAATGCSRRFGSQRA